MFHSKLPPFTRPSIHPHQPSHTNLPHTQPLPRLLSPSNPSPSSHHVEHQPSHGYRGDGASSRDDRAAVPRVDALPLQRLVVADRLFQVDQEAAFGHLWQHDRVCVCDEDACMYACDQERAHGRAVVVTSGGSARAGGRAPSHHTPGQVLPLPLPSSPSHGLPLPMHGRPCMHGCSHAWPLQSPSLHGRHPCSSFSMRAKLTHEPAIYRLVRPQPQDVSRDLPGPCVGVCVSHC